METEWVYTEEPHRSRRKQILRAHPEIRRLMGHDPWVAMAIILLVALQMAVAWLLRDSDWLYVIFIAYVVGGTCNNALLLAIHEISHNLVFGHVRPLSNRLLGFLANLPLTIPYSITFKKYHIEHHRHQGDQEMDIDIPSNFETDLFRSKFTKLVWVVLLPILYVIRGPLCLQPMRIERLELANVVIQLFFDAIILDVCGWKSLVYLAAGTFLGLGLHPVAGHFISSHHMFVRGQETYSYYGILNKFTFNVGYHNEHHDFPNIPCSKLPMVKQMAPEFYVNLPCHTSWVRVIYDFIVNPDITLNSRVKRKRLAATTATHAASGLGNQGEAASYGSTDAQETN